MQRKRFDEIDVLRAFGIVGVIVVHVLTYNLSTSLYKFLWNYLQFVVVAFVFCSGFVLTTFYQDYFSSISKTISWYKKRFIRLIIPFWIYLIVHFSLWLLFPNFFQGLGLSKNINYFINSVFFIGGTNFNWLPLLFLQLTFLFPVFTYFFKKKIYLFFYILISGIVTLGYTIFKFPYSIYRIEMILPWSLVLLWAMYFAKSEIRDKTKLITNSRYFIFGIVTFSVFLTLYFYQPIFSKSFNFYDHKYPPDFYYLFFGASLTSFSLLVAKLNFWQNKFIKPTYSFISKNSYQIFFIHYILLDLILTLSKRNLFLQNPIIMFVIIFSGSIFISIIFQKAVSFKKAKVI